MPLDTSSNGKDEQCKIREKNSVERRKLQDIIKQSARNQQHSKRSDRLINRFNIAEGGNQKT